MKYFIPMALLYVISCREVDTHGHSHDASGDHTHEQGGAPSVDTTFWTDHAELFVEFPALVVGTVSRFAVHVSLLDNGHQPVTEGSVTVSLIKNKKGIRQTVNAPSSPGLFIPSLQPKEAGVYQLMFEVKTEAYEVRRVIEGVKVFSSIEEATESLGGEEEEESITFLKEQAWQIEFETAPVSEGEIYQVVHTSGTWQLAPGTERALVATMDGVVSFGDNLLTEGMEVSKSQVLMTISSKGLTENNLQAEIAKAKATYEQAYAAFERKQQLYKEKVIAKAEFEEANSDYQVAKVAYETLKEGYVSGAKQIRAPFDGYVISAAVPNGSYVEQGAELLTIGRARPNLLEITIDPSVVSATQEIHDIWYQPEPGRWSSLTASGGKVLSVSRSVEASMPLLSIHAQVNEVVKMPEGGFTEVHMTTGAPLTALKVPESALLEDYGQYVVIVQLSGERFERRPVTIGRRNGNEVEVKTGLAAGERVVTKGVYQVKMAAMSGQVPGHGHAH